MEDYAHYYSVELAVNVARDLKENVLKCLQNGGFIPFGYAVNEKRLYYPVPVNALIVAEIFEKYANGTTKKVIIDDLNNRGIKALLGGKWTVNSVSNILKNRKFIGDYNHGEPIVPNAFDAITTQEIFDKVQKRLQKNKHAPARFKAGEEKTIYFDELNKRSVILLRTKARTRGKGVRI